MDFERELRNGLPRGQKGKQDGITRALWANPSELPEKFGYDPTRLFLGFRNGKRIGWKDDRHVVTVAGSRAGKGVSLMIPNLLLYEGSAPAFDPKGELARITGRARIKQGPRVHVLDPFGENGVHPSSSFNPLAELDPNAETVIDDVSADCRRAYSDQRQGPALDR